MLLSSINLGNNKLKVAGKLKNIPDISDSRHNLTADPPMLTS